MEDLFIDRSIRARSRPALDRRPLHRAFLIRARVARSEDRATLARMSFRRWPRQSSFLLSIVAGAFAAGAALAACSSGGSGTGGTGGAGSTTVVTSAVAGPDGVATVGPGPASTGTGSFCGDGNVDPGEECDTAGASATCDADCTFPVCGDGVWNPLAGEECDDGDTMNGDACDDHCKPTVFSMTASLPGVDQSNQQARVIGTGNKFLVVYSQAELTGDRTLEHLAYDRKGKVSVNPTVLATGGVSLPALAVDGVGAGRIAWGAADALYATAFANGGALGVGEGPIAYTHFAPGSLVALDGGGYCVISLGGDTRCRGSIQWGTPSTLVPFSSGAPFKDALLAPHTGGFVALYRATDDSHAAMPLDAQAAKTGAASLLSAASTGAGPVGYVTHADGSVAVVGVVGSPSVKAVYYPFLADGTLDAANQHDLPITDADVSIVGAPSGQFVMAYRTVQSTPPTSTCQVSLQLYSSTGTAMGSPRVVGSPPTDVCDRSPRVARSQFGDVLVTWRREDTTSVPAPASYEAILIPGLLAP